MDSKRITQMLVFRNNLDKSFTRLLYLYRFDKFNNFLFKSLDVSFPFPNDSGKISHIVGAKNEKQKEKENQNMLHCVVFVSR